MLDVFLCCSRADRNLAAALAARLERMAEARVWLEECNPAAGETVASAWEAGLSSAAILLLLSPEAVPRERTRTAWQSVLDHLERRGSPPLASLLLRDCDYARLLERRRFFRWSDGETAVLRALTSWLVTLHPAAEPTFVPARLPRFLGRNEELERLWTRLVDGSGSVVLTGGAGSGKTSLAQEFARAAAASFRDVLWVDCGGRSPAFLAGDLESQLGIRAAALDHRVLLVLDDVAGPPPVVAPPEGPASILITTRSLGSLGAIPIERAGAIPDRPPADAACERLWRAMGACRRNGLPLELAAGMAGLASHAAHAACELLVAEAYVDPLDGAGTRFRLSGLSQAAALAVPDSAALRRAHASALHTAFSVATPQSARRALIAELEHAIDWALLHDWDLARALARRSFQFLKANGRLREAARVYELLRQAARDHADAELAQECSWELSWIQDEPGQIRRVAIDGRQLSLDFN